VKILTSKSKGTESREVIHLARLLNLFDLEFNNKFFHSMCKCALFSKFALSIKSIIFAQFGFEF
jgi:hypothetical protein